MRLYLDESGYTGEDLLNREQTVFVLAATSLSEDASREIASSMFRGVGAAELKHSSLVRRPRGRHMLLEFVAAARRQQESFSTYMVHKEFCALTKFVDLWVESAMHRMGFNLYERGANIALSNMTYFCLRGYESPQFLRWHLLRFQTMMRERTREAYVRFWNRLRLAVRQRRPKTRHILSLYESAEPILGYDYLVNMPEKALDVGVTIALQTVGHWRNQTNEELQLLHDRSSSMAREKWLWDAITAPDVPEGLVGFDRRTIQYPLRVRETRLVDSRQHIPLQLCDLLAGATATWAKSKICKPEHPDYVRALQSAGIGEFLIGAIWPDPSVEAIEVGADQPAPVDFVDHLGDIIRMARERRRRTW